MRPVKTLTLVVLFSVWSGALARAQNEGQEELNQATAKKLGLSMEKVVTTVERHANTSAASIPLALDEAVRDGRIRDGQRVLLAGVGGGFTWGSVLVQW